jgi:hypothetical protein
MAVAMEWVARITASAVMMVLPGLGGQWVDRQLGTNWLALVGFAVGITLSIYYLLAITRADEQRSQRKPIPDNSTQETGHKRTKPERDEGSSGGDDER